MKVLTSIRFMAMLTARLLWIFTGLIISVAVITVIPIVVLKKKDTVEVPGKLLWECKRFSEPWPCWTCQLQCSNAYSLKLIRRSWINHISEEYSLSHSFGFFETFDKSSSKRTEFTQGVSKIKKSTCYVTYWAWAIERHSESYKPFSARWNASHTNNSKWNKSFDRNTSRKHNQRGNDRNHNIEIHHCRWNKYGYALSSEFSVYDQSEAVKALRPVQERHTLFEVEASTVFCENFSAHK